MYTMYSIYTYVYIIYILYMYHIHTIYIYIYIYIIYSTAIPAWTKYITLITSQWTRIYEQNNHKNNM